MTSDIRQQYIKECEEAYKKLLGLESFPEYNIKYKTITMKKSEQQKLITPTVVTFLNGYMTGWLNQASIDALGDLYGRMIVSLATKFHLH